LRDDVGGPVNNSGSERGLLAMAADPDYLVNGRLYVYYTGSDGDVTIARYTRSAVDADTGSLPSASILRYVSSSSGATPASVVLVMPSDS